MAEEATTPCSGCQRLQAQLDAQGAQIEALQAAVARLQEQFGATPQGPFTSSRPLSHAIVKAPLAEDPTRLPPPRPVRTRGTGCFRWGLPVCLVALGCACAGGTLPSLLRLRALDTEAQKTEGRILRVEKGRPSRGYLVLFAFRPGDGPEVTGEGYIPAEQAKGMKPGEAIPVTYLPDDPERNSWPFEGEAERRRYWTYVRFFLGASFFCLSLVGLIELVLGWDRYLASHGVLAWARVVETGEDVRRKRRKVWTSYWMRYEFQPEKGAPVCCRVDVAKELRDAHRSPGARLPVLYLPGWPRCHRLLTLFSTVEFLSRQKVPTLPPKKS